MEVLGLENCENYTSLPSFGLLSSLKHLTVKGLRKLKSMGYGEHCSNPFQSLETLWFEDFPEWEYWDTKFEENGVAGFSSLRELSILNCSKFSGILPLCKNSQLESLCIRYCDSLTFIARRKLPSSLKWLEIANCENLQHLVDGEEDASVASSSSFMGDNSQLERLVISGCDSLTFIARWKLPSNLKWLEIENCENLRHLVYSEEDAPSSSMTLKHLEIRHCPELTSLSSGIQLVEVLEELYIWDCQKLESIPDGLRNLQRIDILGCPSLVSLAERGLPNTISSVRIWSCEKLESLPNDMHELNSLQHLCINRCPSIVRFPEKGFPTNLVELEIRRVDVKMYKAIIHWGLHRLTSLRRLWIEGCDDDEAECFPDEEMGMMLPTSLSYLSIIGFRNLKMLSSKGFQSLTSLEFLWIDDCPNLTSFPEAGLPSSILWLNIWSCPKLEKVCKWHTKEGSKIANIPCVCRDGQFV